MCTTLNYVYLHYLLTLHITKVLCIVIVNKRVGHALGAACPCYANGVPALRLRTEYAFARGTTSSLRSTVELKLTVEIV